MAASPNFWWYQHRLLMLSADVDCRCRGAGLGDQPGYREKVLTAFDIWVDSSSKRLVSSVTCTVSWSVVLVAAMVGVGDASIMRSASCANCSRFRSLADGVSTIQTLIGSQFLHESRIHGVNLISQQLLYVSWKL